MDAEAASSSDDHLPIIILYTFMCQKPLPLPMSLKSRMYTGKL